MSGPLRFSRREPGAPLRLPVSLIALSRFGLLPPRRYAGDQHPDLLAVRIEDVSAAKLAGLSGNEVGEPLYLARYALPLLVDGYGEIGVPPAGARRFPNPIGRFEAGGGPPRTI